jgi:phosphoglycolate phosphatase
LLASALPGRSLGEIEALLIHHASTAPQAPAVPLAPFLADLRARGLRLGVMTNDAEAAALAHLDTAKVRHLFDFIAGFDSGYGAKPAPQPLLAFAAAMGMAPAQVVMVGDSTHDLIAGRAAGMKTIAVLTGMAGPADLAPLADAVLPDIGHIPGWLQAQGWG